MLVALNKMPASAFHENGLTLAQSAHAGHEASAVNALLGLGDLAHTGVVPGTTTPEQSEASGATAA